MGSSSRRNLFIWLACPYPTRPGQQRLASRCFPFNSVLEMKLRNDLLEAIERFLGLVSSKTFKRGRGYFTSGSVRDLNCVEPNYLYTAVVRGGEDYEVGLEFNDGDWAAECSCPVGMDCKHIVAALLELRKRANGNGQGTPAADLETSKRMRIGGKIMELAKRPVSQKTSRGVPQPSRSPVCEKLTAHLGRELLAQEAAFIRQVQTTYAEARFRNLTETDLSLMAIRHNVRDYWTRLELWPDFPSDDFYFWLYIAWELRCRDWRSPGFMDGITDFSLIEPAMKQWEREREIERWNNWFREFNGEPSAGEPTVLELRLAIFAEEARLQWRTDPNTSFTEFKQAHAKKFAEQFDKGALTLAPDSLPLWSAVYKPWHYDSWWSFKYANASARPALNRLLRMHLAPDRVVDAGGLPLRRATEPLRLNLHAPENSGASYELALETADGSPPPPILCALDGRPALYLTAAGLYQGPRASALETGLRKTIPAP